MPIPMRSLITLGAITLLLTACYRTPNDSVQYEDLDLVQTHYNASRLSGTSSYPNTYKTFVVADSFQFATNVEGVSIEDVNQPQYRIPLRQNIIDHLLDYGYLPVSNPTDTPDVYISLTVSYINTTSLTFYPIFWGGAGGWGYPYYGWGGGYYYPSYNWVPSVTSYDQGTMIIDWMDIKNAVAIPDNDTSFYNIDVEWEMVINGLVRNSSDADRLSRLQAAISQGFEQSPYLKN